MICLDAIGHDSEKFVVSVLTVTYGKDQLVSVIDHNIIETVNFVFGLSHDFPFHLPLLKVRKLAPLTF